MVQIHKYTLDMPHTVTQEQIASVAKTSLCLQKFPWLNYDSIHQMKFITVIISQCEESEYVICLHKENKETTQTHARPHTHTHQNYQFSQLQAWLHTSALAGRSQFNFWVQVATFLWWLKTKNVWAINLIHLLLLMSYLRHLTCFFVPLHQILIWCLLSAESRLKVPRSSG